MPVFYPSTSSPVVLTVTTNTTAPSTDATILCDSSSGNITITLPSASNTTGISLTIKKIDNSENTITVQTFGSESIWNITASNSIIITSQGTAGTVQSNGTAWYLY